VKPNYRSLGPRFGKAMPQAAAAVEALDPNSVRSALAGERELGISIDGTDHTLSEEDVALVMEPLDGYRVEAEAGRAVAVSVELDDGLIQEGLAREVVHAVQGARRDAGLDATDRISLALGGDSALLESARAHEAYLTGETLAEAVTYDGTGAGVDAGSSESAEIDGRSLTIGIERV
ncbi:MAG: DUF5915 domain-containing protein, partial [Solirubrobacterales bacterium]